MNPYEAPDHENLAKCPLAQESLRWIVSYDDSKLVRELYESCRKLLPPLRYVLQDKRKANELVASPCVSVPSAYRRGGVGAPMQKVA